MNTKGDVKPSSSGSTAAMFGKKKKTEEVPPREPVYHEHGRFYHANATKSSADALLAAGGGLKHTGRFLVRPKGKGSSDALIVSVVFKGKATHHALEKGANGVYVPPPSTHTERDREREREREAHTHAFTTI